MERYTHPDRDVEAWQYSGDVSEEMVAWLGDALLEQADDDTLLIREANGRIEQARPGDYLVRDALSQVYVCNQSAFELLFQRDNEAEVSGLALDQQSSPDDAPVLDPQLARTLGQHLATPEQQARAYEHAADTTCPYPHGERDEAGTFLCPVLASYIRADADALAHLEYEKQAHEEIKAREALAQREMQQARVAAHSRAVAEGRLRS